jgi:hypothetical protein
VTAAFDTHVENAKTLFAALEREPLLPIAGTKFPAKEAIYVFYLEGQAVHVGRTRNLKNRLRGHVSNSHYSASFAFKRARGSTGKMPTYKKGEGRGDLLKDPVFAEAFEKALAQVKGMQVRHLSVEDPIDQYLLELYAAMRLETSLSEFGTH